MHLYIFTHELYHLDCMMYRKEPNEKLKSLMIIGLLLDRFIRCIEILYSTCVEVTIFQPRLQFQLVTQRLSPKVKELPSPNQLKNKIMIKHKKKGKGVNYQKMVSLRIFC